MRALLSLFAIVAVSGCQQSHVAPYDHRFDPSGGYGGVVESLLLTDAKSYAVGTPVTLRLVNRTGRALGYNLCNSRLERNIDGDWVAAMTALADVCTAELRSLSPGQSVSYTFQSSVRVRAGEYRIATALDDLQARSRFAAVSNRFMLTRDGSD